MHEFIKWELKDINNKKNIKSYILIGINYKIDDTITIPDIYLVPKSIFQENKKYWLEELKYTTLYDEIELPEYEKDKIIKLGWTRDLKRADERIIKQVFILNGKQIAWSTFHSGNCEIKYLDNFSSKLINRYKELYNVLMKQSEFEINANKED